MFFILFVNDYPRCLKYSNVTIYADDTSQDVTDKSVDIIETKLMWSQKQYELDEWKQINNELEKNTVYICWLEQNKDCQNVEKFIIWIENVILETVEVPKLLGVNIACCLTWSNHLEISVNRISKKLGVLKCLKPFMSGDALLKLYNCTCIIFPHFNYCCTVCSGAKNNSNIDRLLKL